MNRTIDRLRNFVVATLFIVLGSVVVERTNKSTGHVAIDFPSEQHISQLVISRAKSVSTIQIGKQGVIVSLEIIDTNIEVPWTAYLPFYQFGHSSGRITYNVRIPGREWTSNYLDVSYRIKRFAIVPEFLIGRKLLHDIDRSILDMVLALDNPNR